MDQRAIDATRSVLLEYFSQLDLGHRSLAIGQRSDAANQLQKSLDKYFGEYGPPWFLLHAAENCFMAALKDFLDIVPRKGVSSDMLSRSQLDASVEQVLEYFLTLPKTYLLFFPLPSVLSGSRGKIGLLPDIFFFEFDYQFRRVISEAGFDLRPKSDNQYLPKHEIRGDQAYLCVRASGLFDTKVSGGVVARAIAKAKQFLFISDFSTTSLVGSGVINPVTTGFVIDEEAGLDRASTFLIPSSLGMGLGNWEVYPWADAFTYALEEIDADPPTDDSDERSITALELQKLLESDFDRVIAAFGAESNPGKLSPGLLNACRWAFDAIHESDEMSKVLCLGIACEALLGSGSQESVTRTLADRLAYLVGESHQERESIQQDFIRFYKLRSNVAHGNRERLSNDELSCFYTALGLFSRAIRRELSSL